MTKNLLIGAVDLYEWDKIRAWAISARETGYDGDIALLAYRVSPEVVANAKKLAIDVYQIEHDAFGQPINHTAGGRDTQCHQLRFFHAWQMLRDLRGTYKEVMITDVRDVMFQRNPFTFIQSANGHTLDMPNEYDLYVSSEGMLFEDEPWNTDNLLRGFGPYIVAPLSNELVCNVGVLRGTAGVIERLCLSIFTLTQNRYIPSDQSAFNVLLHTDQLPSAGLTTHNDSWACQCGTMLDPEKAHYQPFLKELPPIVNAGRVYNAYGELFTVVHQYDRVPALKAAVEARYV